MRWINLTYAAVVKTKLFSVRNLLVCKHTDGVLVVVPHFVDGLAVGGTAVTQTARVVPMQDRVDS
jgi:hypothetical protein